MTESHSKYTYFRWPGDGKRVFLSGSFTDWQKVPLTTQTSSGDVYRAFKLSVGLHYYHFYVDGKWQTDPFNNLPLTIQGFNQIEVLPILPPTIPRALLGKSVAHLFLKFHPSVKHCFPDCIIGRGYDKNFISMIIMEPNTTTACVLLVPESLGAEAIKDLNGMSLDDEHVLEVMAFQPQSDQEQSSVAQENIAEGKSGNCKVIVGPTFPDYILEQHMWEHFKRFGSEIIEVELLQDIRQFIVTFSSLASGRDAIGAFNNSLLKGSDIKDSSLRDMQISVSFSKDLSDNPWSMKRGTYAQMVNLKHQNAAEVLSSPQPCTRSSGSVGESDKCKVFIYSDPKFPNILSDEDLKQHFRMFNPIDAYVIRNRATKETTGIGVVAFSSRATAERAILKMKGTKVLGNYSISLKFEDPARPSRSAKEKMRSSRLSSEDKFDFGDNSDYPFLSQVQPPTYDISQFPVLENTAASLTLSSYPLSGFSDVLHGGSTQSKKDLFSEHFGSDQASTQQFDFQHTREALKSSIKVSHVSHSTTVRDLRNLFEKFGELDGTPKLFSPKGKNPYARVNFKTPDAAESAYRKLHNTYFKGSVITIKVTEPLSVSKSSYTPSMGTPNTTLLSQHFEESATRLQPKGSIKVSHVSQSVTVQDLRKRFEVFGELDSAPKLFSSDGRNPYARIDFKTLAAAESAYQTLHNTTFKGSVITIKVTEPLPARIVSPPSSGSSTVEEVCAVMKLLPSRWTRLMTVVESTGSTLLNNILLPYHNNRNISIQLLDASAEKALQFSGKKEAVEYAYQDVTMHLNSFPIHKLKMEALVYLKPSLASIIEQKCGVHVTGYRAGSEKILFDGPIYDIEKAHEEMSLVEQEFLIGGVSLKSEFQEELLDTLRERLRSEEVYISLPESPVKNVLLLCYSSRLHSSMDYVMSIIESLLVRPLPCKPEEAIFLQSFVNESKLSQFPARLIFDGEKVFLTGSLSSIECTKTMILNDMLSEIHCHKVIVHFDQPTLISLTKERILIPFKRRDSTFDFKIVQENLSTTSMDSQDSATVIYIFCKNLDVYKEACKLLDRLNPGSKQYSLDGDAKEAVMELQDKLENKFSVKISYKQSSVVISGLIMDEIQQCYEELTDAIESTQNLKQIPLNVHQGKLLDSAYEKELLELRNKCSELTLLVPNENSDDYFLEVTGSLKQVKEVMGELKSRLLSMKVSSESFSVTCDSKLYEMWKKYWQQLAAKEEKGSKTLITFYKVTKKSSAKTRVTFEIIGTSNDKMEEIKSLIRKTETETKDISLSREGVKMLDDAKRTNEMEFLGDLNVFISDIDLSTGNVTVHAPKEVSDDLDAAAKNIREFVRDNIITSDVISSKDPVVQLVLQSGSHFEPYLARARTIAGSYNLSINLLKTPSVGVQVVGIESSVKAAKSEIVETTIRAIEKDIDQKEVSVRTICSPFLVTPDFSTLKSELEDRFLVTSTLNHILHLQFADTERYMQVNIFKGNILQECVDAIVNPANEDLKHFGGLALDISDTGGPDIQSESDKYIEKNSRVSPGSAVCLGSGRLSCKNVIHAVGPRWSGGERNEESLLCSAVLESLKMASENSLTSISLPAISTGIFGVPEKVCAKASLKAVKDFCQDYPDTSLRTIRFVLFSQSTVDVFCSFVKTEKEQEVKLPTAPSIQAQAQALDLPPAEVSPPDTHIWKWSNDQGSFSSYTTDVNKLLNSAYRANPRGSCQITVNRSVYKIDFAFMLQINVITGFRRKIKRKVRAEVPLSGQGRKALLAHPVHPRQGLGIPQPIAFPPLRYPITIPLPHPTMPLPQSVAMPLPQSVAMPLPQSVAMQRPILLEQPLSQPTHDFVIQRECKSLNEESGETFPEVAIILRGPKENLSSAAEKLLKTLDDCIKSDSSTTLPEATTEELETVIKEIAKENRVISSFEMSSELSGKQQKVLKLMGTKLKIDSAKIAILQEIVKFHDTTTTPAKDSLLEEVPAEWVKQTKDVEVFELTRESDEWEYVASKFELTMEDHTIVKIIRIQNTKLWRKYAHQKKVLKDDNNGIVNEMELFHGSRGNDPKDIYEGRDGFDMRYSASGMWGRANYFAVNAKYCHNYAHPRDAGSSYGIQSVPYGYHQNARSLYQRGNFFNYMSRISSSRTGLMEMFLVKVLTGESLFCPSNSELRMPPFKPGSNRVRYDTVSGNTAGSMVYMTYDNEKAYPAYLITYM